MAKALATYLYHDASEQLVRLKYRYPGKRFSWSFMTENGPMDGYGDEPDLLYNLPAVLRAVAAGDPVWVCEGEKDADALIALGHVATTPPHPERQWTAVMANALADAVVWLAWDRDLPGHKRAHFALRSMRGIVRSVECYRASVGNDVSDHLAAGLDVDELVEEWPPAPGPGPVGYDGDAGKTIAQLTEEAGEYGEAVDRILTMYADEAKPGPPRELTRKDILALPPPQWRVAEMIPAVGLTVVWGSPGASKSTLMDDWTDTVCRGEEWNGYSVMGGSVYSLIGEAEFQYRNRLVALEQARGPWNGAAPATYTPETWDITSLEGLARAVARIARVDGLAMITVDPAGLYSRRGRDGVEDTDALARACKALAFGMGCSVLLVAHANALGTRPRGTDHLNMYCETIFQIEKMGSRSVALSHDDKNRGGVLKAMRFDRETVGPGPVLVPVRGAAGDEYTPEDVAREKLERKVEGKERSAAAAAEDPENWKLVLGVLEPEGGVGVSLSQVGPMAGLKTDTGKAVLNALVREGRVVRKAGPRNGLYHWLAG
jgi:hypothetical protein